VDEQNETSGDETPAVPAQTCFCHTAPSGKLIVVRELGMDQHYAEVSLLVCPDCRQSWLRYLYELEAISNSGRWYLGALPPDETGALHAEDAKALLESLPWYFCGGSYYGGRTFRSSGPLSLG
jgi:uncharacterized protein YbaR (Trm112 family)